MGGMTAGLITGHETTRQARSRGRGQPDDFLGNFSVADHARIRSRARHRELEPGDCLFDQGSVATAAFLVTGGQAQVIVHGQPVGQIATRTAAGSRPAPR
jgi:hypothetical protein